MKLVYTVLMRMSAHGGTLLSSVLFASLVCACADEDGDEDTAGDDTSSTTLPATTAPAESSSEGGSAYECDANTEFALGDGVELEAQSVDAIRLEVGGDVQYTVTILGTANGTNELDIIYPGLPVQGMEYQATAILNQFGQPRVDLVPEVAVDFITGTVTYTMVGTAEGEPLALEFHLEYEAGTIEGCVQTELTVETG